MATTTFNAAWAEGKVYEFAKAIKRPPSAEVGAEMIVERVQASFVGVKAKDWKKGDKDPRKEAFLTMAKSVKPGEKRQLFALIAKRLIEVLDPKTNDIEFGSSDVAFGGEVHVFTWDRVWLMHNGDVVGTMKQMQFYKAIRKLEVTLAGSEPCPVMVNGKMYRWSGLSMQQEGVTILKDGWAEKVALWDMYVSQKYGK